MTTSDKDNALLARLRAGDEDAFAALVDAHHASLIRVGRAMLRDQAAAEEVAQETWIAVIHGLDRFEGRAALRTWIFAIFFNQLRRHARATWREQATEDETMEHVIHTQLGGFDETGHWLHRPVAWPDSADPEAHAARRQLLDALRAAIDALPDLPRAVVTMRDVEGLDADEVCQLLQISEGNLRVILHRARLQLRAAIEPLYLNARRGTP